MADNGACAVCLSQLGATGESRLATSCGHIFHEGCLRRWLVENPECPVCRTTNISSIRVRYKCREDESRMNRSVVNELEEENRRLKETNDILVKQNDLQERKFLQVIHQWRMQYATINQKYQDLQQRLEQQVAQGEVERLQDVVAQMQQQIDQSRQELKTFHDMLRKLLAYNTRFFKEKQEVSVRNLSADMAAEPQTTLDRILSQLNLQTPAEHFHLETCTELLAKPGLHQLRVRCEDASAKLELLVKFPNLKRDGDETLRPLQILDSRAVSIFYRQVNRRILGKRGLKTSRLQEDQVVVQLTGDTEWREIEDEDQAEGVAAEMESRLQAKKARTE